MNDIDHLKKPSHNPTLIRFYAWFDQQKKGMPLPPWDHTVDDRCADFPARRDDFLPRIGS